MKRTLRLIAAAAILCAAAACKQDEPQAEKVVEITMATLQGTWEGSLEHDMAQGYMQKYRITFWDNTYTLWHAHQTYAPEKGETNSSIKTVGNKEEGIWVYGGGNLTLIPARLYASYFISNMDPLEYTVYPYNLDTMEADPWYESPDWVVEMTDETVWQVSLRENALNAKINMDTFVLAKKK